VVELEPEAPEKVVEVAAAEEASVLAALEADEASVLALPEVAVLPEEALELAVLVVEVVDDASDPVEAAEEPLELVVMVVEAPPHSHSPNAWPLSSQTCPPGKPPGQTQATDSPGMQLSPPLDEDALPDDPEHPPATTASEIAMERMAFDIGPPYNLSPFDFHFVYRWKCRSQVCSGFSSKL
jgi:hypothetical protein